MQESINEQRPEKIFADVKEVEITRAIAKEFYSVLQERAECDVIIIGAGYTNVTAVALFWGITMLKRHKKPLPHD